MRSSVSMRLAISATFMVIFAQVGLCQWSTWGGNLNNGRYTKDTCITSTKNKLFQKWQYTNNAVVSATPTVCGGKVFFPDDAGQLFALDANSGKKLWQKSLSGYVPEESGNIFSRTSPAVTGDCSTIVIGTKPIKMPSKTGSYIIAIDAGSGNLKWKKKISTHVYSQVTQSATIYQGSILVGTASSEENQAGEQKCCNFRGKLVKLNLGSGAVQWEAYMTIDNKNALNSWSGCAIWGSSPVVDTKRNLVFVATGNNYKFPQSHQTCLKNANYIGSAELKCNPKENYVDSVVAVDIGSGKVKWAKSVSWDYYAWWSSAPGCKGWGCWASGPDRDFAQGPILTNGGSTIVAAQKNGKIWGLDAATGKGKWTYSTGGQLMFGSASDDKTFYYGSTGGNVGAVDTTTGKRKWEKSVGLVYGPLTVANDVLFVPDTLNKKVVWMDAKTGAKLGEFGSGGFQFSGPAVVKNMVYFGSGYGKWSAAGSFKVTALQATC